MRLTGSRLQPEADTRGAPEDQHRTGDGAEPAAAARPLARPEGETLLPGRDLLEELRRQVEAVDALKTPVPPEIDVPDAPVPPELELPEGMLESIRTPLEE